VVDSQAIPLLFGLAFSAAGLVFRRTIVEYIVQYHRDVFGMSYNPRVVNAMFVTWAVLTFLFCVGRLLWKAL
jgi:hypothetical protein